MLDLKDFFHLPEVDVLLAQVVNDSRGITVVAGMGRRSAQSAAPGVGVAAGSPSDRVTILALLMRHILDRDLNGRPMRASVVGSARHLLPVAQHQQQQVEFVPAPIDHVDGFTTGLQQAMMSNPDLMAIDRLNTVTAPATFHAAATGRRVLTQIDTALVGGDVLQEIVGLGCSPSQMSLVAWVVAVQPVPTLCTYCKQPHIPGATLLDLMIERHSIERDATFYTASGCRHCQGTGYIGELAAFDIFRVHGGVSSFSELVSTPSLLPLEGYLARLAAQGYVPLEDAARLGQVLSPRASVTPPVDESARTLQRKLAEVEAANKVLAERIEALLALHDAARSLGAAARLDEAAARVAHDACELSGADRAVLYWLRPGGDGRVLAVVGWDAKLVGKVVSLPDSFLEAGDPASVAGAPPGIRLSSEQLHKLQAGLRVSLAVDDALLGVLVVNSLHKTRFEPGRVSQLKTLGELAALALQRARDMDGLRDRIAYLDASQKGLIDHARHEREFDLARELQRRALPDRFPAVAGVQFASAYRPAREVACDVFDVIDLGDGRVGLFIGDVAGRGWLAAHQAGLARALMRQASRQSHSPRAVLSSVNQTLREASSVYLTAVYAVYESATRRLVYSRAGHAPPLWLRADGHDVLLGMTGMPIGLIEPGELDLGEGEIFFSPGDVLVLYTDGCTDAPDPYGAEFGVAHWVKFAREHFRLPADRLCAALVDEVAAFQAGTPPVDDMALLVMRVSTD